MQSSSVISKWIIFFLNHRVELTALAPAVSPVMYTNYYDNPPTWPQWSHLLVVIQLNSPLPHSTRFGLCVNILWKENDGIAYLRIQKIQLLFWSLTVSLSLFTCSGNYYIVRNLWRSSCEKELRSFASSQVTMWGSLEVNITASF